ncbi:RNA polymerase subunit sigma-70 [Kribbella sp. ALI-6-A]|uniref:RNA polymerase subunit sigma-70 n=1 Tax=Kribbella sp. ALI-6-A TaxID=1933817 RepID=UPI00097BDBE4|nr:RNA polymerase subunit sigma-70 [Kribbella sp. ALI-6-A]ONI72256.1 RNA polymerase subunit sigma-70 [Kribbella sp. ALI-6-A]
MTCTVCGKPIASSGGPGRTASYCSPACRQRAYRERRRSPGLPVQELISDIADRARRLRPTPPTALHADVEALSTRITQLRRVARQAREENVTPDRVTLSENVTPGGVTNSGEDAFTALIESHRNELRAHCYRLLGSYDEAEDLTQETFLRAWRSAGTLAEIDNPRAWLYKIATNACLDFLRKLNRQPATYEPIPGLDSGDGPPPPRIAWLQPYPDDQLPERPAPGHEPDEQAVASETLELVFLTAIQHLPPRQRAAVILRDVARWSAQETAELLGSSLASANSAVQRGRAALREALPQRREDWSAREPSAEDRALLQRYMDAAAVADIDAMVELVRQDAVLTMPPNPFWFTSRDALFGFVRPNLDPASPMFAGHWRHVPVQANGQLAVAAYLQRPGTSVYRAQLLDVLRFEDGLIAEITTFEPHLFAAFGLPMTW